jgi:hypothetical protein
MRALLPLKVRPRAAKTAKLIVFIINYYLISIE